VQGLPNVAFRTPDGKMVLIVLNIDGTTKTFDIKHREKTLTLTLPQGSVATCIW
jgi:glucosylceramidase